MRLRPCANYYGCSGQHVWVNEYVALWDCRDGWMKYRVLRFLFARRWYRLIKRGRLMAKV